MEIQYKIYSPAGNDTALVIGDNYSREERRAINDKILQTHTNVEQVGFLCQAKNKLTMAGGEFCGNATRCAAHYYLQETVGEIDIEVAENAFVKAGISKRAKAWVQVPLLKDVNTITRINKDFTLVRFEGISHLVSLTVKEINAMQIIEKYGLENELCVGIILASGGGQNYKIDPYVWVREIDTLFNEKSCLSGTAALAMCIADESEKTLYIKQPSGKKLKCKITRENDIVKSAIVSGIIDVENDFRIPL